MKKLLSIICMIPVLAFAQSQDQNYVKTTTFKGAGASLPVTQVTYFDGLGRPIQQIANAQSSTGNDIVTHMVYDDFGRMTKEFLPYANTLPSLNYNPSAGTEQATFYNKPVYENTLNPYSEKGFEPSPLNRILEQAAPGTDWAINNPNKHTIRLDYQSNTATDVKYFKATATKNNTTGLYDIAIVQNLNYNANELYKTITKDENWTAGDNNTSQEFKNKDGQVVLKRTFNNAVAHDTYYVYDQYGNLTYVLPPKAVDLLNLSNLLNITTTAVVVPASSLQHTATNSVTMAPGFHAQPGCNYRANVDNSAQGFLDNLCYQYKYDYRNRLVEKKLPGKQWEYIVYDKLDRPVATGPALSPFSDTIIGAVGWMITKYDVFNRPVYTAWQASETINSAARNTLQVAQNAATVLSENKVATGTIDGIACYYSNLVAPTSFKLLTVNYYDNYLFPNVTLTPASIEAQPVLTNVKTLATGSWIRTLDTSVSLVGEANTVFYDAKARPIGTYSKNFLGGYTNTASKLDFIGKTLYTITQHKRLAASTELYLKDDFTYSSQERLLTQTHQIGTTGIPQLMASNTYDELGQLMSKKVGKTIALPLQIVDYTYNIRGWLKKINNVDAIGNDLFAFQINYNDITNITQKLYNGNISQTYWKTANDLVATAPKNYVYTYDHLNRLTAATDNLAKFNETLSYDKNGNITNLKRLGEIVGGVPDIAIAAHFGIMDDLSYTYDSGNKLQLVNDNANDTYGFKDDLVSTSPDTTTDYTYDANGNMVTDTNKGITAITYNHLNLPTKITLPTGNISYIYNAVGQKVQKKVNILLPTPATTTITDYLGGFQYIGGVLQFFPTAEGYAEPSGTTYKYVFQYKDHLGNIRLSYQDKGNDGLADKTDIVEENNYYPFGMKQKGYNYVASSSNVALKYKYNGKELQDELGLNVYDYGARNYDPALGRWMNMDPLAELGRRWSPYNYALNNPVYFIDPDGMRQAPNGGSNNDDEFNKGRKKDSTELFPGQNDREKGKYREDDPNHAPDDNVNDSNYQPNYIGDEGGGKGKGKKGKGGKGGNGGKPSYTPAPRELPGFPDAEKVKPKGGRPRWKLPDGDIIEWDGQHGELERYNPRGKHKGVWSPDGEPIKDPVPGRKIDPTTVVVGTAATVTTAYIIYKIIVGLATWECGGCGVLITP
jgi:RHS repeat-associated protein